MDFYMRNFQMIRLFLMSFIIFNIHATEHQTITRFREASKFEVNQTPSYANAEAPQGGELKLAALGSFTSLNAHLVGKAPAHGLDLCYETMFIRAPGEPFTLYPRLAQKATIAHDNSFVVFHIHPEAKFSDGTDVTAEDAKFSYETLVKNSFPRYRQYFRYVKKMEVVDQKTLKLHLEPKENGEYDPELPMIFALIPVYQKKQLSEVDFNKTSHTTMIGSGPYKIQSSQMGRTITYEKDPNYWAQNNPMFRGSWNFQTLRVDYYQNAQALFQAFLAGESDIHFETNLNQWISGYKHVKAIREGRMKKEEQTHSQPVLVRTFAMNMRRPIFSNWMIRKALVLAFDFETMNRTVFDGMMKSPHSLFANTYLAHTGKPQGKEKELLEAVKADIEPPVWESMMQGEFTVPHTDTNGNQRAFLEEAGNLLKKAGCSIKNGICFTSDGKPFEIELIVKDPKLEKIGLEYGKSLKRLGIIMHVRMMDSVQYENRVMDSDFDMIIHAWANSLSPGNEQAYYVSSKAADEKGSSNYIGIKDPTGEKLALNISQAKTSEENIAAVHAFDRWIMHQCYQVPIAYDNTLRFAYYPEKVGMPEIDPTVGVNVMRFGWKPKKAQHTGTSNEEKHSSGLLQRIWGCVRSFIS